MNDLVIVRSNEVLTTSLIIAEGTQNEHRAVKQLARTYKDKLLQLGNFDISNVTLNTNGGRQETSYYEFNEPQATFLITLMKNNEIVVEFKFRLVQQFYQMRTIIQNAMLNGNNPALEGRLTAIEQYLGINKAPIKEIPQHHNTIVNSYLWAIGQAIKSGNYYLKKKHQSKDLTKRSVMLGMYDEFCYYLIASRAFDIYVNYTRNPCNKKALYALMRDGNIIKTYGADNTDCKQIDGKKRACLTLYRSLVNLNI